jgi:GT2 family glycosyltransferase
VARSRQIAALVNAIDRPPPAGCRISVVVCTYRRPASLARAIASVATQTLDEDEYEILVVNNDPDDVAVRETVAGTCTRFLPREPARLRLVQCPFPGLSFARNAGIAQARGAIVSFIDDDAVARPDWLERISQVFTDHPDAGVVGGRITLHLPEPRPRWAKPAWRKYWSERATDLHAPTVVGHWWDYPWGANWSARRDVLLAIGGFRTGYGRRGTDAAGGEEIVAASLVQRLGHAIVVAPAAEVIHVPDAARFTLAHVWRRIQATKREEYQQQRQGYLPDPMTLGTTAWAVGRHLRRACIGPRLAPYERLEHLMYACAEARLLVPLLRDRAARS